MKFIYYLIAMLSSSSLICAGQDTQTNLAPNTGHAFAQSAKTSSIELIRMSKEEREALLKLDHRVLLNVVVTDRFGKPVGGLTEHDFTLLDQDKPQTINNFQIVEGNSVTGRAHIVLLVDSVNNSFSDVAWQRRTVDAYLHQNNGQLNYPVSLALLSDRGLQKIDYSTDGKLLSRELREQFPKPGRFSFNGGPSGANQRFLLSINALRTLASDERDIPGRAILVWIGQGWPSLTDPGYEAATFEDKKSYFDALVQLSTTLRAAQITIDNVSSIDPSHMDQSAERESSHGIHRPEEAEAEDVSLATMVQLTGGRRLNHERDPIAAIDACVLEANTYYRMSFDPKAANRSNELRLLTIKVDKPALNPRTYTLYYAQP